jgi:scytalone dehydratase
MSEGFDIYTPGNLSFQDYIAIVQTARIWAYGYDRKVWGHQSSLFSLFLA